MHSLHLCLLAIDPAHASRLGICPATDAKAQALWHSALLCKRGGVSLVGPGLYAEMRLGPTPSKTDSSKPTPVFVADSIPF